MNRPSDAYYSVLYPEPTARISEFGRWKRLTTGRNIAQQLWEARERARRNWDHQVRPISHQRLGHPPVVLWLPEVANAGCLGCEWLDRGSASIDEAADLARLHSIENGDDPFIVGRLSVPISARGGETDEPLGRASVPPRISRWSNPARSDP